MNNVMLQGPACWNVRHLSLGAAFAIGLMSAWNSESATLTVEPVADTELRSGSPTAVVGGDRMVAGGLGDNANNETRRALVRFDVSGIPANAVVKSVQLRLEVVQVPQSPANSTFELRRVLADWSELVTSWQHRIAGVNWQVPGALGASDAAPSASSTAAVSGAGAVTFASTPAMVSDVQGWLADPGTNHGWLLRSQAESTLRTARQFATREAVGAGSRPRLTVEYIAPPVIESAGIELGNFIFQFQAAAGGIYRIQRRANLDSGAWETIQTVGPLATDQPVTVSEATSTLPDGAYFQVTVE